MRRTARKLAFHTVGWVLLLAGVAALVLPGPGLLMMLAGILVLSQENAWAERQVEPLKRRAFEAAEQGVQTWPRILGSTLSACAVIAVGIVVGMDPLIPEWGPIGPHLPFAGWGTGAGIIVSGLIALALIGFSIRRFR